MFESDVLEDALTYSHTIDNTQLIFAEWNLNQSYNINKVGNYRYRPGTTDAKYGVIRGIYENNDPDNYYTGATDSDIVINAGFDDSNNPAFFTAAKKKMNLLYSLEDCFKQNRPRSGINKLLYLGINGSTSGYNQYIDSLVTFKKTKEANILNITFDTNSITYFANNNFVIGDYVKVQGVLPASYNFTEQKRIIAVTDTSFTVSGTNTASYQSGGVAQIGYLSTVNIARRPRYYMASRYDSFKYWTSYRTEVENLLTIDGKTNKITREFGISVNTNTGTTKPSYYIYDAAPFVVYNDAVATNRIAIKMQTNVGDIDNGPYRVGNNTNVKDPLYGESNKTVPKRWAVQYLNESNEWKQIITFTEDSLRKDGTPIVGSDGQVELEYGIVIPNGVDSETFTLVGQTLTSSIFQNTIAPVGYAYILKENENDKGILRISDGAGSWVAYPANYQWMIAGTDITKSVKVIKKLSNPDYFIESSKKVYREFQFVYGLRIVVDTMNKINSTFDLIELSPRLLADITNKVSDFSVNKTLSDLGNYSMPTGNLLASTGSITIFDDDLSFNSNNTFNETTNQGSIVSQYSDGRIKFLFYDIIENIDGYDYYIPIKTLYSEKIPQVSDTAATISFNLRDLFFLLESKKSPELLLTNVSLSYAITVLLDNIGFSNYVFKRTSEDEELIIPYFFVGPDQNMAQTLQELAMSSQSAIFFDEYNNLIIMSKNYIMPSTSARKTDLVLYGQETEVNSKTALPNIINVSSQDKTVYNGGEINYTTRYIQKSIGSIAQAPYIDEYKTFIYKPVLLWEVAGQEATKTINESATQSSGYSLAAMPLKTTLTSDIPSVYKVTKKKRIVFDTYDTVTLTLSSPHNLSIGRQVVVDGVEPNIDGTHILTSVNSTQISFNTLKYGAIAETDVNPFGIIISNYIIDFGESIYWLGNYSGYFYANAEIIRYDAVEYSVAGVGNVWIKNNQEYQDYFSKLRFNGKMYPSGRVRIYVNAQNGEIKEHGRGQFGTDITEHLAGINTSSPWINDDNVRGCIQNSKDYLFNTNKNIDYPTNTGIEEAGNTKIISGVPYTSKAYAIKSTRNGIIKNFMANTNLTENDVDYYKTVKTGSIQSSALVFNGPSLPSQIDAADFVTYSYKSLDKPYKHFGTRMRIIGRIESGTNTDQTPVGAFSLYSPSDLTSEDTSKQISLSGGSGGIAFGLNKDTNVGYYFEIAALTQNNVSSYKNNSNTSSYTIVKSPVVSAVNDVVTAATSTQYDFEIGTVITITGLIDDNNKTNTKTRLNGEFSVTGISQDRKVFTYKIPSPVNTTAVVTQAVSNGSTIVYTANNHSFSVNQVVTITGMGALNATNAIITSVSNPLSSAKDVVKKSLLSNVATITTSANHGYVAGQVIEISSIDSTFNGVYTILGTPTTTTLTYAKTAPDVAETNVSPVGYVRIYTPDTFTIASTIATQTVTATGLATYQTLSTTSSNGGNVVKVLDNDTLISNVFFYKIVSGSNTADILKKERTGTLVTLTTLRDHSLVVGENVNITGVDSLLNGTYQITEVGAKYIKYNTTTSGTIAPSDLNPLGLVTSTNKIAIPEILWRGFTEILVDDGKFTSQSRLTTGDKTTVYDLSAEYLDIGSTRQFYLYLNNKQIAVVNDTSPLPQYNNIALFLRGTSRCMFENVYALSDNFAENTARSLQIPVSKIFGDDLITESEAIKKYAISGIVQNTYLSGISSESLPAYSLYYEEFGTIMREAAYFNIKYDRAYPALYAQLAATLNRVRGYTVSGFIAGSYGAEFLIFNAIDKNLNLDDTSGNYLRILGIAFTQNTTHSLKVDDYFKKNSNFIESVYSTGSNSSEYQGLYNDIENSRNKYGKNDFSINTQYVQTTDAAESMMDWIIKKVMYPRKTIGVVAFGVPHIQLGDITTINYSSNDVDILSDTETRFVVYNIEYKKSNGSVSTTIHLAEV